jgi:hypothetical protein
LLLAGKNRATGDDHEERGSPQVAAMAWETKAREMTGRHARETDIPEHELQQLMLKLADAQDWAAQRKAGLGYALLLRGLIEAEGRLLEEKPWAGALIRCWREVIDRYCNEYDRPDDE